MNFCFELAFEIMWQVFPLNNCSYLSFLTSPCALFFIMRYGTERHSVAAGAFVFTFAGSINVVWGILSSFVDQIIFCYNKKFDTIKFRYFGLSKNTHILYLQEITSIQNGQKWKFRTARGTFEWDTLSRLLYSFHMQWFLDNLNKISFINLLSRTLQKQSIDPTLWRSVAKFEYHSFWSHACPYSMHFPYTESIELSLKCQNIGPLQPMTTALVIWIYYLQ